MKSTPKVGDLGQVEFTVGSEHVIDFADETLPAVLSTPTLVGFLERAAREALAPVLEAMESSLGTHVDVQHLAPTPQGQHVVCRARVIHVDGRTITFQIEARDGSELVARGLHKRAVIRKDRFAARVERKRGTSN
jgi:predicted thioesterase